MSTLPGLASKGEKAKQKYQSLDINSLYRVSRGENLEKQQQKSTFTYKHGMQSLGKVPNARRPPANLPSLKSEHSGNDASVPLVPPGGPGWGKQESTTSTSTTSSTTTTIASSPNSTAPNQIGQPPTSQQQQPPLSSHQANIALPVTTQIPPPTKPPTSAPASATTVDKSWSAVMSATTDHPPGGNHHGHPPLYHSPQFQHEFPSLSTGGSGEGVAVVNGGVGQQQYAPGLSLRPQTEGSWMQGGGVKQGVGSGGGGEGSGRPGSVPLGGPPQLAAQVGLQQQQQQLPPQFRAVMPNFMYKGSFVPSGPGAPTQTPPMNGRNRPDNRAPPRLVDPEDITPRPIIKEEELSRMDEIDKDLGWTCHDDIDYNQKLAFSDDETLVEKPTNKKEAKSTIQQKDNEKNEPPRNWNTNLTATSRPRTSDEELWKQRRQHNKDLELTVQRAKQRKEEEEKRFNEATKQGAAKKLQELEEKMNKRNRAEEENAGTINPSVVPPKPIIPADVPLPDFQKDRSRTPNDEDKSSFRQLTQIEGKNFANNNNNNNRGGSGSNSGKHSKSNDQNGPNFSRQFQNQLPPRFQKQRNTSSSNFSHNFDNGRWNNGPKSPERDFEDDFGGRKPKDEDRWQKDMDKRKDHHDTSRPQRPDSRDSRASRDSRHSRDSEPREHIGSWAETVFEPAYEERRSQDRRVVPGPITKERMEADDMKNEKRGLTQLKKGQMPEKKILETKEVEKSWHDDIKTDQDGRCKAWADAVINETEEKTAKDLVKEDVKKSDIDKDDKRGSGRNRNYGSGKGWGSGSEYHRSGWPKRQSSRGGRKGDHLTDSEGSMDDANADGKSSKTIKKSEKEDKNKEIKQGEKTSTLERNKDNKEVSGSKRDNYVPRGEPSRHGRGGGNFRGRGGLSKRIDGYGPPPAKSPFGHHEDRGEKKSHDDDAATSADDKAKQNQQALSAGIIGTTRKDGSKLDEKSKRKPENRRGKSKSKKEDETVDSNSDNSEEKIKKQQGKTISSARGSASSSQTRRNNPPPRLTGVDKKPSRNDNTVPRQNSSGTLRSQIGSKKDEKASSESNSLCNAIADISLKNKSDADVEEVAGEEKVSLHGDSDGFQEVKSKKTVKERQKSSEEKLVKPASVKSDKDSKPERKNKSTSQLTQQQISNIPPLMATPVNPPPVLPQTNKNQFERPRQTKLAPRFAKQRENNRLQKAQMQQNICEVNDLNKVNQNINVYGIKDSTHVMPQLNAWEKSIGNQFKSMESENVLGVPVDGCKTLDVPNVSQSNSPSADKVISKNQLQDKAILDGTTPPVNTIIFENTNFKSAPGSRNSRSTDKPARSKVDEGIDSSIVSSFNKPMGDLLCKNDKQNESIQIPLSFKEDNADIKLDFFDSELSHLTEEKTSKNLCISSTRSMHAISNNTISTADALNFKIQSVKKMWDTEGGQDDNNSSFSTSFDPNTLDPNAFGKGNNDTPDDNHEGYSPSPNQVASNSTTNVCKVKPTQQVSGGGGGQAVLNSNHQQHGIMGPSLMGNPLSPPPLQPVIGTGVNLGQPPQQYATNQHLSYQASLGGSSQYGIPAAIPSPPNVMFNSTQQMQQTGLYGTFQIDQLGGQGRSQYSQYPNHYSLGQTGSSPYSTQSVYLQTQHPPQAQAPPDLYQNLNNYRLSATGPFGQNQQLNNPTTVLISSTSNSLMSASVKPSSQQISAIGTKAGGVGQAYQQQSQQSQQVYMAYDPALQANYMPSAASVIQRGPTGPVQNNVVPTLQPSSSYYSGSTGQTGYFQQPGSSTIQSAQLQQHQAAAAAAGYGIQGNVFGTHNQSHTNAGLQSFNSHFFSPPVLAAAAALTAQQQFRSAAAGLPAQYLKGAGSQPDQTGRSQQLKSPGSQEMLSSVFNTGSQISSPKLRANGKQPPPQPSPTAQHKYNFYQGVGSQQTGNMQRYPPPIQRPVNFQQNLGSVQQNNSANQKHRSNNSKPPSRQYYQSNSITSQNEKIDDTKLSDTSSANNVTTSKSVIGTSASPTVTSTPEISKDAITIEETATLKD